MAVHCLCLPLRDKAFLGRSRLEPSPLLGRLTPSSQTHPPHLSPLSFVRGSRDGVVSEGTAVSNRPNRPVRPDWTICILIFSLSSRPDPYQLEGDERRQRVSQGPAQASSAGMRASESLCPRQLEGPRVGLTRSQCRKQKLRCLGGWPCKRCTESGRTCDFGPQGFRASAAVSGPTSDPTARLAQLESSVANLLAGLSGQPMAPGNPARRDLVLPTTDPQRSVYLGSSARPAPPNALTSPPILAPNSVSPLANFQLTQDQPADPSPDHRQQVRFIGTPNNIVTEISPRHTESEGSREVRPKKGKNQKAEDRLALATEESFEAPFRPLVYQVSRLTSAHETVDSLQPSIWENREPSRRNSPERTASVPSSRDELSWGGAYDRQTRKDKDDPVNSGILDLLTAEKLFEFFVSLLDSRTWTDPNNSRCFIAIRFSRSSTSPQTMLSRLSDSHRLCSVRSLPLPRDFTTNSPLAPRQPLSKHPYPSNWPTWQSSISLKHCFARTTPWQIVKRRYFSQRGACVEVAGAQMRGS